MAHSPVVAEISRRMWDMSDLIINTSGATQPLAFAVPARHEDHGASSPRSSTPIPKVPAQKWRPTSWAP